MKKKKEDNNHLLVPLEDTIQSISSTDIEIEDVRKKYHQKLEMLEKLKQSTKKLEQEYDTKNNQLREIMKKFKASNYTFDFNGLPLPVRPRVLPDLPEIKSEYRLLGPDGEEENKIEPQVNPNRRQSQRRPATTGLKTRRDALNSRLPTKESDSKDTDPKKNDSKSLGDITKRHSKLNELNLEKKIAEENKYKADHMGNLYQQIVRDFQPQTGVRLLLPNKPEDNEVDGATLPSDFELEDSKGNIIHQMTKEHFYRVAYAQREKLYAEAKERYFNMKPANLLKTEQNEPRTLNTRHNSQPTLRDLLAPQIEVKTFNPTQVVKRVKRGADGNLSEVSVDPDKSSMTGVGGVVNESRVSSSTQGGFSKKKDKEKVKDMSRVLETGNYVDLSSNKKGAGKNSIVMNTESRLIFMMFDQNQSRNLINTIKERATPYKDRPPSPQRFDVTNGKSVLEEANNKEISQAIKSARQAETQVEVDVDILRRKYSELGVKMSREVMARAKTPNSSRPSTARTSGIHPNLRTQFSAFNLRGPETNWKKALQSGQSPPRIKKAKFFITDA